MHLSKFYNSSIYVKIDWLDHIYPGMMIINLNLVKRDMNMVGLETYAKKSN